MINKKNKLHKILLLGLALLLALCFCVACGNDDPAASGTDSANTLPTVDRAGNTITLPEEIDSIASLAPSITQLLLDLGFGDALVAVDPYSASYWPEAGLADLPQFEMMTPDAEQLAALQPDVIFVSGMSYVEGDDPFAALVELGCCLVVIPSADSIEGIREDIRFVADCLGVSEEGDALVTEMDEVIAAVSAVGSTITEKKSVSFEISALPWLCVCGNGTYLHEMLEIIGATNCFASESGWVSLSEEAAVAANPDVILTSVNYLDDAVAEVLSRDGWADVTAVREQAVYYIDPIASNLPNHHITEALLEMALAVYPDAYAAFAE